MQSLVWKYLMQCQRYHPFHYKDPRKSEVSRHDQCPRLVLEVMVLLLYDKISLLLVSEVK